MLRLDGERSGVRFLSLPTENVGRRGGEFGDERLANERAEGEDFGKCGGIFFCFGWS